MISDEVNMNIKAVLIDIDNTLLDFDKSAFIAMNETAKKHNVTFPEGYFDVFLRINDKLWKDLECGIIVKQDIYNNRWNMIFKKLGICADGKAFEEDFRKEMRTTAVPVDGAEDILKYLSEKYPIYTASNASKAQQKQRLEKTGLMKYITEMFTSEDIGFQKPAKEFFYFCIREMYPLHAEDVVMIGDSVDADIIGAKNFGIKSIWFDYNKNNFSNIDFTDYRITNLLEIKNIL